MSGIVGQNPNRGSGVVGAVAIADESVDSDAYVDGSVDLAHLQTGTDGQIITWNASGNPVAVGPGSDGEVLTSTGAGSPPAFEAAAGGGKVQQIVYTEDHSDATSGTTMPWDDTIPQNTEGFEVMTRAITPTSSSSILIISAIVNTSNSSAILDEGISCALFQDTTANAIAATATATGATYYGVAQPKLLNLTHHMVAGTTSSTTFKIRIGGHSGTTYFNQSHEGHKFGDMYCSSITIIEYTP